MVDIADFLAAVVNADKKSTLVRFACADADGFAHTEIVRLPQVKVGPTAWCSTCGVGKSVVATQEFNVVDIVAV